MSKENEISLEEAVIDLQMRMIMQEKVMEFMINNNPGLNRPSPDDMKRFDEEAFNKLKENHPDLHRY